MDRKPLGQVERGCLLIADITGYTSYLQETELEHAQDVLADLLETIVNAIEPTFKLSKLEGDAAFAYAPSTAAHPSMMLDTVELAYFEFRRRLRDVTHATSCECNACVLIPSLDLKLFVHEGEYVVRTIARTEELTGPDVILIHRLLKGSAGQSVGKSAFAVYTASTLESFGMDPAILGFTQHTEQLDDVGELDVLVQDLDTRWRFEQERNRLYVTEDKSILVRTYEFPGPPPVVWDSLTNPAKRAKWQSVTSINTITAGRTGDGTVNHCMHGEELIVEHVMDWRPYHYYTVAYDIDDEPAKWPWTFEFEAIADGTRVTWRLADLGEGNMHFFEPWLADFEAREDGDLAALSAQIAGEAAKLATAV